MLRPGPPTRPQDVGDVTAPREEPPPYCQQERRLPSTVFAGARGATSLAEPRTRRRAASRRDPAPGPHRRGAWAWLGPGD